MMGAQDTTAAARRVQVDAWRRLDGPTRLLLALQMSEDAREVTLSGIRHRHPEWDEAEVHAELLRVMLGVELAEAVLRHLSARL